MLIAKPKGINRLPFVAGLATCAAFASITPLAAQNPAARPVDVRQMPEAPATPAAKPLLQPVKPGEKQGFIRRQVGRDVNPDQPAPDARPLPLPESPATRQGFIRRQVGRDVNPDQQPQSRLKPTIPDPVAQPAPGAPVSSAPRQR